MKPLDKKQLPQLIALGVLTAGAGTYAAVHFAAPGPASAQTHPAAAVVSAPAPGAAVKPGDPKPGDPKPGAAVPVGTAGAPAPAGTVAMLDPSAAPPPVPGMRDPFAVGYSDPAAAGPGAAHAPALPALAPGKQMASVGKLSPMPITPVSAFSLPSAPALPGASRGQTLPGLPVGPSVPALPASITPAPAPPTWTVTGVLAGAGGKVAILRSGEARRIVRSGDFVDSTYRVTAVSRTAVILRHGPLVYQIKLGGDKAGAAVAPSALPASFPSSAPPKQSVPIPAASRAVLGSAIIPVYHVARPAAPLVHLTKQGLARQTLLLATEALSVPRIAPKTAPKPAEKIARNISLGLRLLDGTVLTAHKD